MMTSRTDSLLIVPFMNVLLWAVTLSAKRQQTACYSEEMPHRGTTADGPAAGVPPPQPVTTVTCVESPDSVYTSSAGIPSTVLETRPVMRSSVTCRAHPHACEKRCGLKPPLARSSARASAPRSRLLTAATTGGSLRPARALMTYAPKPTTAAAAAAASAGSTQRDLRGLSRSAPKVPSVGRGCQAEDEGLLPRPVAGATARWALSAATTSERRCATASGMGGETSARRVAVTSRKASQFAWHSAQPARCDSTKAARSGSSRPSAASANSSIDRCWAFMGAGLSWDQASGLQPLRGFARALVELGLRRLTQYPCEEGRMAAPEQGNRRNDTCGFTVLTSYGEAVGRPIRSSELCDTHQVGRLDGVELSKAPNGQPRSVHQQVSPRP